MRNKIWIILIALAYFCFLSACSTTGTDPASLFKDETEAQLFQKAEHDMLRGHYDDATKRFETLEARYPFGDYSRQTSLDLIYAYYKNDDTASALVAADRYIRTYPRGPNADYAYYLRGIMRYDENHGSIERFFGVDFSRRDLTTMRQAYLDFSQLVSLYPKSDYAADARARMVRIRNIMAQHDLETAQFYFKRRAYVAAINRANAVVRHYEGAPSIPDALSLVVQAYRELGLTEQADDALKVLKLNYTNTDAYRTAVNYSPKKS